MSTCSDGCGGCLVTNDGHPSSWRHPYVRVSRVCGRPHVANRWVERRRRASLISRDVQQTTATLQESWCQLHHGLSLAGVLCQQKTPAYSKRVLPVASPRGGMEGSGPPHFCSDPSWDYRKSVEKFFLHIGGGGTPCMYIVTFTAHQQRNMVRTPPLFWGWRRHWVLLSTMSTSSLIPIDQNIVTTPNDPIQSPSGSSQLMGIWSKFWRMLFLTPTRYRLGKRH